MLNLLRTLCANWYWAVLAPVFVYAWHHTFMSDKKPAASHVVELDTGFSALPVTDGVAIWRAEVGMTFIPCSEIVDHGDGHHTIEKLPSCTDSNYGQRQLTR